jgi:hypothetical protein
LTTSFAGEVVHLEKFKVLDLLQTVSGVGFKCANEVYDQGVRTLQELWLVKPNLQLQEPYLADLGEKCVSSSSQSYPRNNVLTSFRQDPSLRSRVHLRIHQTSA